MPKKTGRPALPANVHRLTGNRSKLSDEELAEREENELRARPLSMRPPAGLSPYGRECWDRLAPELQRLGLLTVLDQASFFLACETYALAKTALEELRPRKKDGSIDRRRTGFGLIEIDHAHGGQTRKVPAFTVYAQASKEFRSWCIEFGLSPSGRASLRPAAGSRPAGSIDDGDGDGAEFSFGY